MFTDEAEIEFIAGHGGAGKVSFHNPPMRGPDGGNGGKGGDIYLRSSESVTSLGYFSKHYQVKADNGYTGGSNCRSGKNAVDLIIDVPVSTEILDLDSKEKFEFPSAGIIIKIAEGGKGGKGNFEFRSSRNTTPRFSQPGLEGTVRRTKMVIKLIADLGLIGLPNSGKSSLLNELTAAQAKVGNYDFTTLEPNLGVLEGKDKRIIADIPGIIEGASTGKGLGIKFLKHIEKVKVLLHCISSQSSDPLEDYLIIKKELKEFSPLLNRKKEIILITKSDLVTQVQLDEVMKKLLETKKKMLPVSIYNFDSLEKLKTLI